MLVYSMLSKYSKVRRLSNYPLMMMIEGVFPCGHRASRGPQLRGLWDFNPQSEEQMRGRLFVPE